MFVLGKRGLAVQFCGGLGDVVNTFGVANIAHWYVGVIMSVTTCVC